MGFAMATRSGSPAPSSGSVAVATIIGATATTGTSNAFIITAEDGGPMGGRKVAFGNRES
jgi:hypothetical protein